MLEISMGGPNKGEGCRLKIALLVVHVIKLKYLPILDYKRSPELDREKGLNCERPKLFRKMVGKYIGGRRKRRRYKAQKFPNMAKN